MTAISKRDLWRYVNKRIKRLVHHYHVFSVMSILFEEMIADLKRGKGIKIHNFGTLTLEKTTPRWYHNVRKQQMEQSKEHYVLRLRLSPPIRKKLCEDVVVDAQPKGDYHE